MNIMRVKGWELIENPEGLEGHWITGSEIGSHFGYSDPSRAINKIYQRNQDFFKEGIDTGVVTVTTPVGSQKTRVFSERSSIKLITKMQKNTKADEITEQIIDVFLEVNKGEPDWRKMPP